MSIKPTPAQPSGGFRATLITLSAMMLIGVAAVPPVQAQSYYNQHQGYYSSSRYPYRDEYRNESWNERQRKARKWQREHRRYYPGVVYAPPPVVYYPPPSQGMTFIFPLDFR